MPILNWLSKCDYSLIIYLFIILEGRGGPTTDPVEKRNAQLVDEAKRYVSGVQPDVMALIEARNVKYSDRKVTG